MKKYRITYNDGFKTHFMNKSEIDDWFKMNNKNDKNIQSIEITETMTIEQSEELMKKYTKV